MSTTCPVPQKSFEVDKSRCAALLKLRGPTCRDVASAAGVTLRHLHFVLAGQRPLSRKVATALRDAIGEAGFAFVTRQTDTLHDDRPAGEVAPHAA